ncbi:MAG: galactose mutarotase [Tannerellaceae bacterium]|jgi:aldose 1-epimerase|nr:galactose mutarotase [Tannerellaceae bacterium]
MKKLIVSVLAIGALLSCGEKKEELTLSGLKQTDFVSMVDGKLTALFVLKNSNGAEACITNYGGRLVSMMAPDKNGKMTDVVLGYDNIGDYTSSDGNFGALIGRYGNRIAHGKFILDEVEYTLPQNNNGHCLHGGPDGYHTRVWDAKLVNSQVLELTYLSRDGEAGFPGNLDIKVTYTLKDNNAIAINYEATTDKATLVNLTNHSYFNLSGDPGTPIVDQTILINADHYTPVDETLIPVGIEPVEGTVMDLRMPVVIGAHIDDSFEQLTRGRGYDHNWILNAKGDIHTLAAKAVSKKSGIGLEVYTNEPGVQFYTGNFMSGADKGKHGVTYPHRGAFCLETQHYPDSPNQLQFPSTVLRPGETYTSECIYKFTVECD